MKVIKNLFGRKDDELSDEDKSKIDSILGNKAKPAEEVREKNLDLNELITQLNLEQINELRDLLDRREDELHELYGLKNKEARSKNEYNGTINIEEPVHDEDLDKETYDDEKKNYKEQLAEIEDSPVDDVAKVEEEKPKFESKDEDYVKLDEDMPVEKAAEKSLRKESQNIRDDVYLEIARVFGEENLFEEVKQNVHENLPKNTDILCIGIRKFNAFNKEADASQSSWFVKNAKQLEFLPYFKMLSSTPTSKELFWDRENLPILMSFKSTSELKSIDEFEF